MWSIQVSFLFLSERECYLFLCIILSEYSGHLIEILGKENKSYCVGKVPKIKIFCNTIYMWIEASKIFGVTQFDNRYKNVNV